MSAISDYVAEVTTLVNETSTELEGISADQTRILEKLEKIDSNPGPISTEDQGLLTESLVGLRSLRDRAKALNAKVEEPLTPPA